MSLVRYRPAVLEARLAALACQHDLDHTDNIAGRAAALDVVQQVYQVLQLYQLQGLWEDSRQALRQQAQTLEARLYQADAAWTERLRQEIRHGQHTPDTLRQRFMPYTTYRPGSPGQIYRGYEAIDVLVQGLWRAQQVMTIEQHLEADMVPYAPVPVRVILAMLDQVQLSPAAVFYDIGAGLGHVAFLVHLLSGAITRGVEIEATYCQHAQRCATECGLTRVEFIQQDARQVDYSDGTVFFLYTPFMGDVLASVLDTLSSVARYHPILLCTHGACTLEASEQPWLHLRHPDMHQPYTLAIFDSL